MVGINEIYSFKKMEDNLTNLFKGDAKKEKIDTLQSAHKNTEALDSLKSQEEKSTSNKNKDYRIEEQNPLENKSTYVIQEEKPEEVVQETKKIETKKDNDSYVIGEEELPEIKNTNFKIAEEKPVMVEDKKIDSDTIKVTDKKEISKENNTEAKEEIKLSPKAQKVFETNNAKLFPDNENTHAWDNIKGSTGLSAEHMMDMKEGSANSVYNPYISYIHKLHYYTNLKPKSGETNEQYVKRALQKLSKMEKLDKVKLN